MGSKLVLEITGLTKSYDELSAVVNVSFNIQAGECYALVGPNGAGKTTIAKMIVGLTSIDSGRVVVDGYDINRNPVKVKEIIGYIPDNPYSYPYLSGRQILEYIGDLRGLSRDDTGKRVEELMKYYPMDEIVYGRFGDYSRGNQQKIMIIASLIHKPKLLIIDEPIVGLDAESQISTEKLIKDYLKDGGAVLLSTHTLSFAERVSGSVGFLHKGELKLNGKMAEIKKKLKAKSADLQKIYFMALQTNE